MADFSTRYKGLTLPIKKDREGYFTLQPTRPVIKSSIRMILSTNFTDRVGLPEFGSRLQQLVFEQNDSVLQSLAKRYVIDALKQWEKRITVQQVDMIARENELRIKIAYTINETQDQDSLVLVFARGG